MCSNRTSSPRFESFFLFLKYKALLRFCLMALWVRVFKGKGASYDYTRAPEDVRVIIVEVCFFFLASGTGFKKVDMSGLLKFASC